MNRMQMEWNLKIFVRVKQEKYTVYAFQMESNEYEQIYGSGLPCERKEPSGPYVVGQTHI